MAKTIVILGGSYAGVSTAHRILKASGKPANVKIILVSPNTHFYWNLASTRAIVPGQLADDKVFQPIAAGFKQYPADEFEFIVGEAQSVDIAGKNVSVTGGNGQSVLNYDILILATGSRTKGDVPFKGKGTYEATRSALHDFQTKVKAANSIIVAGAGPTGVEVAGELGTEFGTTKKITLIASGPVVLEGTPASVSKTALKQLTSIKIEVKLDSKVAGTAKTPEGKTEITLSSGTKLTTDLYIPTMGLEPNSGYLPPNLLNAKGFVMVDAYLKVKGAKDVWAVGDIADVQRPQYVNTEKQSTHLAKNIGLVLKNAEPIAYKPGEKDMLAVPVGKKMGTGHMGGLRLPSFMVTMVKGKTLFMDKLAGVVTGSAF